MISLAISGSQGRMGQRIIQLALSDNAFKIQTLLEHKDHPKANEKINNIQIQTKAESIKDNDILIEFTTPEATMEHLYACRDFGVKLVIGTTGLNEEQVNQIKDASKNIAIVYSSNMSIGVNLLFKLTELAAKKIPENYKIDISEAHHIHKKDAPSGTAKTLAQIIKQASGVEIKNIESIREGEIVGDHTITFESAEDILTVTHHAKTRDIFVKGALLAAKFLADKKSGLFSMQDVLDLN